MGAGTAISWTATRNSEGVLVPGNTFNPWIGCEKVSEGCRLCYAEAVDHHWGHNRWGKGKPRERTSKAYWARAVQWNAQAKAEKLRIKVFCASFADIFDTAVPDAWRWELFALIGMTPHLDWLLLTKRAQEMERWLTAGPVVVNHEINEAARRLQGKSLGEQFRVLLPTQQHGMVPGWWPFPNIWAGVTVENQAARWRLSHLKACPTRVHWVSVEPQLEYVDLKPWMATHDLHWVITGGESGNIKTPPVATPYDPEWARALIRDGQEYGVPIFVKQMGSRPVTLDLPGKGDDPALWPEDLRVQEFPQV